MTLKSKKPIVIILLILVVPVISYGVFQLNSLTVDERELTTIYRRQLESVLFSVNQAAQAKSDEYFGLLKKGEWRENPQETLNWLSTFPFIYALYSTEIDGDEEAIISNNKIFLSPQFNRMADSLVNNNDRIVNRLVGYLNNGGFQKVESFDSYFTFQGMNIDFQFLVSKNKGRTYLNVYFFDAIGFIEQGLVPKFQEMAQGDFIITCNRISDGYQVYSTSGEIVGDIESEPLDLLPRFELGIAREGGTVEEAVNRRKEQNLIALGLLMLVMVIGVTLVFRNVQREMQLAQKKADFVSNVSHEIRTPLALINMFAETLLLGRVKDESKKQEYYTIITKEVNRLSNMLNRILSFSKIEAEKRVYQKTFLDLNEVVKDVMNTYSYHLESNGFDHQLNLSNKQLLVEADKEAIIEVLVNLIDNAMKYSLNDKIIDVSTGIEGENAFFNIKDQGIGIEKDQLNKLFEKFYRVPNGDIHDTKGSGLGLSIVKNIVDEHNGQVIIQSKYGKGSEFKVLIPLKNS